MNEQQALHQRLSQSLTVRPPAGDLPGPVASPVEGDLTGRLEEELQRLGGELIRAANPAQAAQLLEQATLPHTGPWFVADLPLAREVAEYLPVDIADIADLQDCQGAVTEARWVIADTGTVALELSGRQPRSCYLLPEIHVAVATADRLLVTLADALQRLADEDYLPTSLVYVTGPSRTADIEKTIVIPAHGPKRLILVLLPAPGEA